MESVDIIDATEQTKTSYAAEGVGGEARRVGSPRAMTGRSIAVTRQCHGVAATTPHQRPAISNGANSFGCMRWITYTWCFASL
jgi:hypothetical protein